jgi:hypothetical protein
LFQGTLAELMRKRQQHSFIVFETSDDAKTSQIISDFGLNSRIESGKLAVPILEREQVAALNQKLVQSGVEVYQIGRVENDLEKIFFDIISE